MVEKYFYCIANWICLSRWKIFWVLVLFLEQVNVDFFNSFLFFRKTKAHFCDSNVILTQRGINWGEGSACSLYAAPPSFTDFKDEPVSWIWYAKLPKGMNKWVCLSIWVMDWQLSKLTSSFPLAAFTCWWCYSRSKVITSHTVGNMNQLSCQSI